MMNKKIILEFDHLDLPNTHRELISKACGEAKRVFLAPMDKGLSGSSVWQARWELPWGGLSKLHVFKIGNRAKLAKEAKAVIDVASVIEPGFPLMHLYTSDDSELALLRQEFMGDPEDRTISLRQYIQDNEICPDAHAAATILSNLYLRRMKAWHPQPTTKRKMIFGEEVNSLANEIPWWASKIKLHDAAKQIGQVALNKSLEARFNTDVDQLARAVEYIANQKFVMDIGPVHGDLHAQNVNIDRKLHLYLIDFGGTGKLWRAVDFLMMECALKFAASPPHATLDDLLYLDNHLENQWGLRTTLSCTELSKQIHGKELEKIAAAICVVRRCAQKLKAIRNAEQYRMGLIFLTASFSPINMLINRVFLFHSLASQVKQLKIPR